MTAAERVFAEAMALPPGDRFELAQKLLETCEEPAPEWWARIEPEVERRAAAVRSGEMKTIPWAEVRANVYARLNAKRD